MSEIPSEIAMLDAVLHLDFDNTSISDLSPLSELSSLSDLLLNNTSVSDLSPLSELIGLEYLLLRNTKVKDLTALSGLPLLREVRLGGSQVVDLRPLAHMRDVELDDFDEGVIFENTPATRVDARLAEIAEIAEAATRLKTLFEYLEDWEVPNLGPDPDNLPPQIEGAFHYGVDEVGQIGFLLDQMAVSQDQDLFGLIKQEAQALLDVCPSQSFSSFRKLLEGYLNSLNCEIEGLSPPVFWNAGNKLRTEFSRDKHRQGLSFDEKPKLTEELRDGLDALLALHNAFVSGNEALAELDATRKDPVDREAVVFDRGQMQAFLPALERQTQLVVAEVIAELNTLHGFSAGDDAFAVRAFGVEKDSLENLIHVAVRQALIEQNGGLVSETAGHVKGALVGGAVAALAPEVAVNMPQLVAILEPYMTTLLSSWHGKDFEAKQALQWLKRQAKKSTATKSSEVPSS